MAALSVIAGWTSPYPGTCAVQCASTVAGGLLAGLAIAHGPIRSLAWLFGVARPEATWQDFARRTAILLLLVMLCVAVTAAVWMPGARLALFLFAWLVALLLLLTLGPKAGDTATRRWSLASCDALAAVYGPFAVAAVHTWWFDGANTWFHARLVNYFLLAPGGFVIEYISAMLWRQHPSLSPAAMALFAALLSAAIVAVAAWLAAKTRNWRWALLPVVGGLWAFAAWITDAVLRA